jgi:hypothetical protein
MYYATLHPGGEQVLMSGMPEYVISDLLHKFGNLVCTLSSQSLQVVANIPSDDKLRTSSSK